MDGAAEVGRVIFISNVSDKRAFRMYAITGITGKVGGAVGRALLDAGFHVRAVARDGEKARCGPSSVAKLRWQTLPMPPH